MTFAGRLARSLLVAAAAVVAIPAVAAAHSLTGKVDSPLPFAVYIVGAAVAVALSFLFVAISDPGPPRDVDPARTVVLPRWVRLALRTLGLVAWLWIVAQTVIGGSSDADVASLFLWTYGWVGLAIVSALVFPIWSWIDPFSTLHDIGAWVLRTTGIRGIEPQPCPERLAHWPAVIGLFFFIWLELVAHIISGRLLGIVLVGYTLVTLAATAQWGKDAWRRQGETFSVWFAVLGRLAPFALAGLPEVGRLHRRPFASGLVMSPWPIDLVVMVAMGTGSILYDGISQTRTFFDVFGIPDNLSGTILLLAFLGIITAAVLVVGRRVGLAAVGAGLVPVALGYLIAHYFTAELIDGQRILIALSDPFQQGWDLFGTAFYEPQAKWLPSGIVWGIQVAAVVIGHIIGAWAGHAAARSEAGGAERRVSQVPLALLMVVLTSTTLWSLGQNLVFQTTAQPAAASGPVVASATTSSRR